MDDLKAELSDFFRIPAENLWKTGKNSFDTTVPETWLEEIQRNGVTKKDLGVSAVDGRNDLQTSEEKPGKFLKTTPGQTTLQITVLDNVHSKSAFGKPGGHPTKEFEKSLISTLNLISQTNADGLYRDTIHRSEDCYCGSNDFDEDSPAKKGKKSNFHDVISQLHGLSMENKFDAKSGDEYAESHSSDTSKEECPKLQAHTSLKTAVHISTNGDRVFLISQPFTHTVQDALMYSPSLLQSRTNMPLFILYQVLQFFKFFEESCHLDLSTVHWGDVELDDRLWVRVQLPVEAYAKSSRGSQGDKTENTTGGNENENEKDFQLLELMDRWICGELSNFDYLMFLNKLAGRSGDDPNHHPVLPWVSTLETENESWRDLTKTKYRLNKGDDQLDLQYSMMRDSADIKSRLGGNNLSQVPHHIPEFLSDITYYVYMARRTSKDVLCKLVRSYWEPNEYPASVLRMQVWTPDECIPEFYSDPSVFKSIHEDMADLTVPDWSKNPEEFVKKHRFMLESDNVSRDLHRWIDLTFGYKLQGREAVDAKNVCLPLADNHTRLTNRGITQLFQSPHPKRRCKSGNLAKASDLEIIDGDRQLPAEFNPLQELDELEKLLNFKVKTWNRSENTPTLDKALGNARNRLASLGQLERAMSDRNVVAFICLMVELYLPLQSRTKTKEMTLGRRFKVCIDCYLLHKHLLPSGILYALEYFTDNLQFSVEQTVSMLTPNVCPTSSYTSIFKTVSDRGLPPPTPAILLSPYVHVLPFPLYFAELYGTINAILAHTRHYTQPLIGPALELVSEGLKEVFEKLHDTAECLELITPHIKRLLQQPTPSAVQFLVSNFETISKAMGPQAACDDILPLILNIYSSTIQEGDSSNSLDKTDEKAAGSRINHVAPVLPRRGSDMEAGEIIAEAKIDDTEDAVMEDSETHSSLSCDTRTASPDVEERPSANSVFTEIYKESFLLQLNTRLGSKVFLENFPRCLADALVSFDENEMDDGVVECSKKGIGWMMQRVGPTLTSKYVVRHLFRVLNRCFLVKNDPTSESSPHKRVLDCLVQAAAFFGPSIITLQYLAMVSYNVFSAVHSLKFTSRNQAALEASVAAVTHFLTYLSDTTLMEQLPRLSKEIIIPIINQLAKPDVSFPGGSESRKSLCKEVIHLMALVVIRIGREMSRQHLTTLFQKFFRQFSDQPVSSSASHSSAKQQLSESTDSIDIDAVVINHDLDTDAYKVGSTVVLDPPREKHLHSSWFTDSPCPSPNKGNQLAKSLNTQTSDGQESGANPEQEISITFCPEMAYCSYVSFTRYLGNFHMEKILGHDHDHIWKLSTQHERLLNKGVDNPLSSQSPISSSLENPGITMVGNRIIVSSQTQQKPEAKTSPDDDFDIMTTLLTSSGGMQTEDHLEESVRRTLQVHPSSQLTENWLAYWEHEIGLPETDRHIHFNQIELQRFSGHGSSVRCLCPDQSEEWFLSGGKDKTVKIWSLCRNEVPQDGKDTQVTSSSPYFTYKGHKKTVTYVGIAEAERLVISNDGNLHAWDPYTGQQVFSLDGADVKSGIAVAATLPSPYRYALVVTNETNLRIVDFRKKNLAHEFKTTAGTSVGIVRAMCVSSDGQWAAMGYSSGVVTILDVRIGTLLSMRQSHETDISAMQTVSETRFLTAAADQSVLLCEVGLSSPLAVYKSYQEPVNAIETFNDEIIATSVANRVTVHVMPNEVFGEGNGDPRSFYDKPVAVSKLRSDSFKGVLTTFSVLPMKRQLLIASDNGNIKLMA